MLYFILVPCEHLKYVTFFFQGFSNTQSEIFQEPPNVPKKLHKRFKLDNGENNQQQDVSESSDDDCLQVSREVFVCNSSSFNDNDERKNNIQPGK